MKNPVQYSTKLLEKTDIYTNKCPLIIALDMIGGKWKLPILWHLFEKKIVRYNELKRTVVGVTNMMLSKCLKELEENKLVSRKQYNEIPPRVEYSLTERGIELIPALQALYDWGKNQPATIIASDTNTCNKETGNKDIFNKDTPC